MFRSANIANLRLRISSNEREVVTRPSSEIAAKPESLLLIDCSATAASSVIRYIEADQ